MGWRRWREARTGRRDALLRRWLLQTLSFRLLAAPHRVRLSLSGLCLARSFGLLALLRLLARCHPLPLGGPTPFDLLLLTEGSRSLLFCVAFSRRLTHASFLALSLVTYPLGLSPFGFRSFALEKDSLSLSVLSRLLLDSLAIQARALVALLLRLAALGIGALTLDVRWFLGGLTIALILLPTCLLGSLTIGTSALVVFSVEGALVL